MCWRTRLRRLRYAECDVSFFFCVSYSRRGVIGGLQVASPLFWNISCDKVLKNCSVPTVAFRHNKMKKSEIK